LRAQFDGVEESFQDRVADLLRMRGFKISHQRPARTADGWVTAVSYDGEGFPDLACLHPGRGLFWTIEVKTDTGKLSARQELWAQWAEEAELRSKGHITYLLLRPKDWDRFVAWVDDRLS
jgi:hypothetical protein